MFESKKAKERSLGGILPAANKVGVSRSKF
jgi:hypothetical protein